MPKNKTSSTKLFGLDRATLILILGALIVGFFLGAQYMRNNPLSSIDQAQPIQFENIYISNLGFSFEYPNNWKVSSFIVPKGETKQQEDRYTIHAKDSDMEVIEVTKNNWTIEIVANEAVDIDTCGSFGPVTQDTRSDYKYINVLNQEAARMDLENGRYWSAGDQPEPYPQPIMFPIDAQLSESVKETIGITGEAWSYNWCPQAPDNLILSITYYSDEFTQDRFANKTIDITMLNEMDAILKTLKFK